MLWRRRSARRKDRTWFIGGGSAPDPCARHGGHRLKPRQQGQSVTQSQNALRREMSGVQEWEGLGRPHSAMADARSPAAHSVRYAARSGGAVPYGAVPYGSVPYRSLWTAAESAAAPRRLRPGACGRALDSSEDPRRNTVPKYSLSRDPMRRATAACYTRRGAVPGVLVQCRSYAVRSRCAVGRGLAQRRPGARARARCAFELPEQSLKKCAAEAQPSSLPQHEPGRVAPCPKRSLPLIGRAPQPSRAYGVLHTYSV